MKKSFTLIELLVVIGIVILLTIGSVAGISASRDRKQAKTTAEKLKSFLTEARSQAMTPSDTSFGVTAIKFNINNTDPNAPIVSWQKYKGANPDGVAVLFSVPRGVKVENSANMTCSANDCYFNFDASTSSALGQLSDLAPASSTSAKIRISNSNGSYILEINKVSGLITITQE